MIFSVISAEAEQKLGKENLKIYSSTFTPMYYAVTEDKHKCSMKLICAGPEQKVMTRHCRVAQSDCIFCATYKHY